MASEEKHVEHEVSDEKKGHDKKITIFVNGQKKEVIGSTLSYEQVVNIAYDNNPPTGQYVVITVVYKAGEGGQQGSLLPGNSVKIKNGMKFNVTATDKS